MSTHIAVHVDEEATVDCHAFTDRPPILAVHGEEVTFDLAPGHADSDVQLAFAADLLAAVLAFHAGTQRYFGRHAATPRAEGAAA
ncbi:MAG: hypothetical protein ACRDYU_01105 [Actinomycetes bacterium]